MSTAKGRSIKLLALALGLLIAVGAWILLGTPASDNVSQVITEQWMQIYYDPDSPSTGMEGDVTIVVFLDYDIGDCRDAALSLNALREADKRVRLVFKYIPISAPGPDFAARAASAAAKQDMFLLLHKALLQGPLPTETSVIAAAERAGLDTKRLRADMDNPTIAAALKRNKTLMGELGISSLPAFIVGGQLYRGTIDREALSVAVARVRTNPSMQ
jgi:protein-disulfide isomerase